MEKLPKEFLESAKEVEEQFKDLFKLCYPRRIIPPSDRYRNPRLYAADGSSVLARALLGETRHNHVIGGIDIAVNRLVELNVPTFFIADQFFRAVASTDLDELDLKEIKWPLDAMLFCLPADTSKEILGVEVPWITIARIPKGQFRPKYSQIYTIVEADRLAIHFPVFHRGAILCEDFGGLWPLDGKLNDLINSEPFADYVPEFVKAKAGHVDLEEDRRVSDRVMRIAMLLLLAIVSRPNSVQMGRVVRPVKDNQANPAKNQDELWSANVIGRDFKMKKAEGVGSEPTGRTLRVHIRRGHFRHQRHGIRNSLIKVLWIEPYWVNLDPVEEVKTQK